MGNSNRCKRLLLLCRGKVPFALLATSLLLLPGCGLKHWLRNDFKVGPEYCGTRAAVADAWIETDGPQIASTLPGSYDWWSALNDPVINRLVERAYGQNLTLREAGFRVLAARAQRAIAVGNVFPQAQSADGSYSRSGVPLIEQPLLAPLPEFKRDFDDWVLSGNLSWELDLWGKFRRAVAAADANLNAQIENYDDVLVILQAEVAAAYIQMRTLEQRLELARKNAELQKETLDIIEKRFRKGVVSELDVRQAKAQLAVTESLIPMLEEAHRKVQNALCLLLGMPPGSLEAELAQPAPIPAPPAEVVVGIPAELLRRRPDVRRAERQAAAQCARIGIAEAEFYPHIAITGTISLEAEQFSDLSDWNSIGGRVGPGFQWNILNYGRILNNVRAEKARFMRSPRSPPP